MPDSPQKSGLISILYLLLFALMPLVYVEAVVDNTLVPRQVFASVVLLAAGAASWQRLKESWAIPWVILFMAVFFLVNLASVAQAINPVDSYAVLSRYGLMLAYLLLSITLLRSGELNINRLIAGISIFTALSAITALFKILQILGQGDFVKDIYEVRGLFGHKNLLSSALMLGLPFTVMASVSFKRNIWRRLSLALTLLVITEIFILRTRGVWVATFAGFLVSLASLRLYRQTVDQFLNVPYRLLFLGAGLALVILAGLFVTPGFRDSINDRSNLDRRIVFWENSLEMIKEQPYLGVGAGNWRIHFPKHGLSRYQQRGQAPRLDQNVYQGITHIQRPHNDYLWVWSEAGPLALLAYLGLFILTFRRLHRNILSSESKEEISLDILSAFGMVAYLVFSFTDFPLERTSHQLLFVTFFTLAFRNKGSGVMRIPAKAGIGLVVLLSLYSLYVGYYRWQGESHTLAIHEANSNRNARRIIPAVDEAENSFYNMDQYANPLRYYSSIGKLAQKNVPGAFEDIQMAYAIHPYNIIVINQMGNVHKKRGEWDQALGYYQEAVRISRWFEAGRLNLAEVYLEKDDPVNALKALSLVRRNSRNPKYLNLLARSLPRVVETYAQHGRFGPLVQYLQQRNPRSAEQYVQLFLQFRLPASEAQSQAVGDNERSG